MLTVDLEAQVIRDDVGEAPFPLDPFAKHCLSHGVDQFGFLLKHEPAIRTFEKWHATPAQRYCGEVR
jgi:3-isopropylmalate/(R)-2-methylmalate dehydratase small subunit